MKEKVFKIPKKMYKKIVRVIDIHKDEKEFIMDEKLYKEFNKKEFKLDKLKKMLEFGERRYKELGYRAEGRGRILKTINAIKKKIKNYKRKSRIN